jgi:hypothetical protein
MQIESARTVCIPYDNMKGLKAMTLPKRTYYLIRLFTRPPLYVSIILSLFIAANSFAQVPAYTATANGNAPGGYYFLGPQLYTTHRYIDYNMILDSAGNDVYYNYFGTWPTYGFMIQPNGIMSYYSTARQKFFLMDSTFTIIDSIYAKNSYNNDLHELRILPNGHYLILAQEIVKMDLSSYHYFNNNGSPGSSTASVICDIIQEQDQNKNVVFEWHAKNYLPFNSVDPFFLSSPTLVDWTHCNALDLDTDGNILMSSRNLDEIIKINRQDSSVMWRFGGKYNQFTFIGDSTPFYGQHDVRRISNGDFTLYDDGNNYLPHGARACEYKLDETNMTARWAWSYIYDSSMYSFALGSVQRLQPSTTLIDWGNFNSHDNICFSVVDSDGANLFKLSFTDSLYSYRVYNYPVLPWSLNRPRISCFQSKDTLYLDAGRGYASYRWNNGSTTEAIAVTSPDTFYVFVPYGPGGFISSERTIITNPDNYCEITSVPEAHIDNSIKIFPNPAHDRINILYRASGNHASSYIYIKDVTGRMISVPLINEGALNNSFPYDISALSSGIYFLSVNGQTFKFIKN